MAKKGQIFRNYPIEVKEQAVRLVIEENMSLREVAKQLDIRSKSQVESWVKKQLKGESFENKVFRKGRPKIKFESKDEEIAYLKAEIEYLKKQYSNLHGE